MVASGAMRAGRGDTPPGHGLPDDCLSAGYNCFAFGEVKINRRFGVLVAGASFADGRFSSCWRRGAAYPAPAFAREALGCCRQEEQETNPVICHTTGRAHGAGALRSHRCVATFLASQAMQSNYYVKRK